MSTTVFILDVNRPKNRHLIPFGRLVSMKGSPFDMVQTRRKKMKTNMGTVDKSIRILFAAAVAILYLTGMIGGVLAVVLGGLAGIMVLTSVIGFCPLYLPIGLSTKKEGRTPAHESGTSE
jgi:O-antigen/teichoic acid export membrane protein